ncbi:hypothetical protein C0Q70_07017 [Pomacea canaliculata]|uniref:Uncharacterized protein n=1 Tax=Pomacea canaliculata TaxID=400727 RepID=A0A2T7PDV5_POMCA|nr:uncharacterized protein LOC112562715 [Pomacea canaliculata]PVD31602.1 hypothetical protein C0Q70_07017 [Pomacea canaliculata]
MKYLALLVLVVVALTSVEAGRGRGGRGGRGGQEGRRGHGGHHGGCHRWTRDNPRGEYFLWTVSSTQENGLLRTEEVEAFAPAGNNTVYKWSRLRGNRPMGQGPIKILYDYSVSPPIVAYGVFARRRSLCVILTPDVDTYDDLLSSLRGLNLSNVQLADNNDDVRVNVAAVEMSNTSGVSAAARSMCQGYCGSRDVTYYSVEAVSPDDDDDDDDDAPTPLLRLWLFELGRGARSPSAAFRNCSSSDASHAGCSASSAASRPLQIVGPGAREDKIDDKADFSGESETKACSCTDEEARELPTGFQHSFT